MTRRIRRLALTTAAPLAAVAAFVLAHDPQKRTSTMDEICGEHHSAAMKASEQTSMHLAEARRSGTLAEMRRHVEVAERAHAEMKKHLSTCMGMMVRMHGGMMGHDTGMMDGMMSGEGSTPATRRPYLDGPMFRVHDDKNAASRKAPSSTYKGTTYYFCSVEDKAAFDKNPDKYVPRTN